MSRKLYIAERFLAVMGLLFYSGVNIQGSAITFLIRYVVLFGTLVLLGLRWRATLHAIHKSFWIWLLIGLLFGSLFWSSNPNETWTQLRSYLFPMTCFSLYLASRFSLDEQFKIVSITLSAGLFLSVIVALTIPSIGIVSSGEFAGSWKGIFEGKNAFGAISVLTVNTLFLRAIFAKKNLIRIWGYFGIACAAIVLSTSKTALVLSFITLLMIFFTHRFRWQGKKSILLLDILLLTMGIVCTVLINSFESATGYLGKGTTLSGRTYIWSYVLERLNPDHFWLGFGKGAFFNTPSNMSLFEAQYRFTVNHAHNGFLEILLDVGFIGLILFTICFSLLYIRSFKLAYQTKQASHLFPISLLNFLILQNITESYLTYRMNIVWILFVTLCLSVNKYPWNKLKQNNS